MPALSVIIPNYNHAAYLEKRIESVLGQTFNDFELILLDDASTDASAEILRKYASQQPVSTVLINDQNSGSPFRQWQKGLSLAKGDWIWIAESDDMASPDFLQTAMMSLKNNQGAALFYCDAEYITPDGATAPFHFYHERKNAYFNTSHWSENHIAEGRTEINLYLKKACTINNTSSVVFRKSVLEEAIQGAETFRYHGDWFTFIRACAQGRIFYQAEPLNQIQMRADYSQSLDSKKQSQLEYFKILRLLMQQPFVTDKEEMLDYFVLNYCGYGLLRDGLSYGKSLTLAYHTLDNTLGDLVNQKIRKQQFTGRKRNSLF